MSDLNRVLRTSARTGTFHGRTAADEQVYFEVFSDCPSMSEEKVRILHALKWLTNAFGRRPRRHARLS